ncbi:YybH family protein [Flavobacteriaceae bacterium LMO-SS05]
MKVCSIALIVLFWSCKFSSNSSKDNSFERDKAEILKVLDQQENAWNAFDLEGFMQGYWKSDELKFYGSNGITQGWEQTLANYKSRYATNDQIGKLNFTIDAVSKIENNAYYVMGQYHLQRTIGDAHGTFMIIFKKIDGEWKIIADSSC